MAKGSNQDNNNYSFPSPYVANSVKNTPEYGKRVFRAIMNATASYREFRHKQVTESRMYALGKQPLQQYLDELNIEGGKQYVNINYTPTAVIQKFEKIIVDDYVQLEEVPKALARAYHIQERKERKKSDLKFRMEFKSQIEELEGMVGFPVEDPNVRVPEDDEELELITSLDSDEREELLMREMLKFVINDNDIESKKRIFLSDIFQVNFGGYHHYTQKSGRIKIDYVAAEDAIYDNSMFENFQDASYAGKRTFMTIGEIRSEWNIDEKQERELFNLAYQFRSDYGNYSLLKNNWQEDWRFSPNRPYDDFTVPVYHIWKKTVEAIGYVEGTDSYGKSVFDIDHSINKVEYKSNGRKKTGVSYPETSYEGWFAGDERKCVVLDWGKSYNQVREGKNKQKVLCPYIFFMPDNRGTMTVPSAVERVIAEVQTLDMAMLKIKLTLASHPPSGYQIDYEALMDIDLGNGTLTPLEIDSIYQQTGKLYIKRRKENGNYDPLPPVTPLPIAIADTINTYLLIYNNAMNNIRDVLGVNPNREGTANLSRVSNSVVQTQIAISQTATYYVYRSFLKATETLVKHLGIRIIDVLTYGNPERGYLEYLGEENIDFIRERENIIATNYVFSYDPEMTKEDKESLNALVQAAVAARELSTPDALMIKSIKDIDIAEKYLRYIYQKNEKKAHERSLEQLRVQSDAQAEGAERAEAARQQTIQIQENLQANQWEIKGRTQLQDKTMQIAQEALKALHEGRAITEGEQALIDFVLTDSLKRIQQSSQRTDKELQQEAQQDQQEMAIQQVQQAVQAGEITEDQAIIELQNMGIQP